MPSSKRELNAAAAGSVVGTTPGAGTKVAAGSAVTVLVSAGYPQLSYDDGKAVHVIDGASGKPTITVPPGTGGQSQAAWSMDGTHLVYSQGGQLWLLDTTHPTTPPLDLTGANAADFDPSLAPTASAHIVAFIDAHNGTQLCFATIGPNTLNPDCTHHPGFTLGHPVVWSPDGTAILVLGTEDGQPRTVRADRVQQQRAVLDARRRLGPGPDRDPDDLAGAGRDRRRLLARRQAGRARLQHRHV